MGIIAMAYDICALLVIVGKGLTVAADILTLSSKGQVVLPAAYRRSLSLKSGDKLAAYARDGVIVLVPLRLPEEKEFEAWLDEAQAWARQEGLSPADVDAAIAEARSDG